MDHNMEDPRSRKEKLESQMENFIWSLKGDLVVIVPDGEEDKMTVSKNVLYKTSCEYITKTLDGCAREATEQTLRFPGWSSEVIHHFLFWAYNHALQDFLEQGDEKGDIDYDDNKKAQTILAQVWLFGDAFKIPKLQNAAMKQIVDLTMFQHTSWELIQLCWEETTDDVNFRPLRHFAVDEARYEFFDGSDALNLEPWQMEMLGKTPGLLTKVLEAPKKLLREKQVIRVSTFKLAWTIGWEKYMVKED